MHKDNFVPRKHFSFGLWKLGGNRPPGGIIVTERYKMLHYRKNLNILTREQMQILTMALSALYISQSPI